MQVGSAWWLLTAQIQGVHCTRRVATVIAINFTIFYVVVTHLSVLVVVIHDQQIKYFVGHDVECNK